MQTNKLACHSFMDADRKHEIPISETKDFITHCMADWINFMFSSIHPALKLKQDWQGAVQVVAEQAMGLHEMWRIPILRNPNPYTGLQVNFTMGDREQTCFVLQRKNYFYLPRVFVMQTFWKESLEETLSVILLSRHADM